MIKIDKPATAPKILTGKGKEAADELKELYRADARAYQNGTKKFQFNNKIYAHKTVKKALKKAQHGKCCFCERKTEIGDVEHFRGKGGYQQSDGEKLQFPGYYWLAYIWDNLFFSCETCNRSFKRNFFPLKTPANRALSHFDDISKESPLIINPSEENPELYIEFIGHQPRAINGNQKGLETIKRTGLDRPFIDDRRRDHYVALKVIFNAANKIALAEGTRKKLLDLVNEAAKSKSEYAGMIRWAIKNGFRF